MQGLKALLLPPPSGGGQDGVTAIAAMVDSLEAVLKDTRQHLAVSAGRDPWAIDIVSSWGPHQQGQCLKTPEWMGRSFSPVPGSQ